MNTKLIVGYLRDEYPAFKAYVDEFYRQNEWSWVNMEQDVSESKIRVKIHCDHDDKEFDYTISVMELLNYLFEALQTVSLV